MIPDLIASDARLIDWVTPLDISSILSTEEATLIPVVGNLVPVTGKQLKVVMSRFWLSPLKYVANLVVVDPVENVKDTPRI